MLAADSETADRLSDPGSLDPLGRLLRQEPGADAAPGLEILGADNAGRYFDAAERHAFALDLSHSFGTDLGHGLTITLARADSGLKALARVLELLGAALPRRRRRGSRRSRGSTIRPGAGMSASTSTPPPCSTSST